MEMIPVTKGGEYLEVHPTTLADHKRCGWTECEKQAPAKAVKNHGIEHPADGSISPEITGDGTGVALPESKWANTPDGEYVNLGDMSKEDLHAMAKKHGVQVHHKSGAAAVIEALQTAFAAE